MSVNLQSKTLIGNWVEERQVVNLEEGNHQQDGSLKTHLHRQGHKGVLTSELASPMESTSTAEQTYRPPESPTVRVTGRRKEALQQSLYSMISREVTEEFRPPPPHRELLSTTKHDFSRDFQSTAPAPTKSHDIYREEPSTYWNDSLGSVMGVSKIAASGKPFHKNTDFSTPVELQMNCSGENDPG